MNVLPREHPPTKSSSSSLTSTTVGGTLGSFAADWPSGIQESGRLTPPAVAFLRPGVHQALGVGPPADVSTDFPGDPCNLQAYNGFSSPAFCQTAVSCVAAVDIWHLSSKVGPGPGKGKPLLRGPRPSLFVQFVHQTCPPIVPRAGVWFALIPITKLKAPY